MNRKGLSDVVTTVLIILMAIMAVVILWNFLQPILKNASSINTAQFTTQLSVPEESLVLDQDGKQISFDLQRDAGAGEIAGFIFGLKDPEGNVRTFRQNVTINELELRGFVVDYSQYQIDDVVSISVTPIFRNNDTGKEQTGQPITQPVVKKKSYSLPNGLVAHWKFDGGYSDSVGGFNAPMASGANSQDFQFINGKRNQAINFTAGSFADYLEAQNSQSIYSSEITVVAWVFPATQTQSISRLVYKDGSSTGWRLEFTPSLVRFKVGGSTPISTFSSTNLLNQWSQIAGVYKSGNEIKLYKNGQIMNSVSTTSTLQSSTTNVQIGQYYRGAIDEVMIFNRALSDVEIQGLYNAYD